jgi:hypothetical protein
MPRQREDCQVSSLRIARPRQLLAVSLAAGLITPIAARLPGAVVRGGDWLADYLPGFTGSLWLTAFNLVPAVVLYVLGKASKRAPIAYWFALAALVGYLLWAHGALNLRASSTAAIALMFVPIYGVGAVVAGWGLGWLASAVTQDDRQRVWAVGVALTLAVAGGIGTTARESVSVAEREARFPSVATRAMALAKRDVLACCSMGRVEVLAYGDFDASAGAEIAVMGSGKVALLDAATHAVKATTPFAFEKCDNCLHMYPHVVPDGRGGILVATSDGLTGSDGKSLWKTRARGFSKTVPVGAPPDPTGFLSYHQLDRIELRDVGGAVRWTVALPVETVGEYVDASGGRFAFAIAEHGTSRQLHVYDAMGRLARTVPLPAWASNVQAVAWPGPGHLLVGGGRRIGVLDPDGREVLVHEIRDTSFSPYHGPDGTAVRFRAGEGAYLAVASHGSSGYARSVLLVFDSRGRLMWQEETNKLRSILAVPDAKADRDVLLVGGMDGVQEYRLD